MIILFTVPLSLYMPLPNANTDGRPAARSCSRIAYVKRRSIESQTNLINSLSMFTLSDKKKTPNNSNIYRKRSILRNKFTIYYYLFETNQGMENGIV